MIRWGADEHAEDRAAAGELRPLGPADMPALRSLLDRDPVAFAAISSTIAVAGADPTRLGGILLGFHDGQGLRACLYSGATVVPLCADDVAQRAFARFLAEHPRTARAISGQAPDVLGLWRHLEPTWGQARQVRADLIQMSLSQAPKISGDSRVRRVLPTEREEFAEAMIAAFEEDLGVQPFLDGGREAYVDALHRMIREGRAFLSRDNSERITFLAYVPILLDDICEIRGIWMPSDLRGRGNAAAAVAQVVDYCRASLASTVTLVVARSNVAAHQAYVRVGFIERGPFATVLF